MSGVAIVRYLLANNSNLNAVVPATRIFPGAVPIKTKLPAISVTQVSGVQRNNVAMNSAAYFVKDRVQVTVIAPTYPLQKSILALTRTALPVSRGTVNGFDVESVLPDIEGPDLFDDEAMIYTQSQDYFVGFNR